MPISPAKINGFNSSEVVDSIVKEIDAKLRNPQWTKDWVKHHNTNPHFVIAVPGTLNETEKTMLRDMYIKAGWGEVICTNSEESNERPGLVRVTLYKNPQPLTNPPEDE